MFLVVVSRLRVSTVRVGFVQIFGSKIQDFFQTFFQNDNFFFQTQGYRIASWSTETLKNIGTKLFRDASKRTVTTVQREYLGYGRDRIRFDHGKNFTHYALVVALKKAPDFLPFFQTLSLFSWMFFHVWNITLQISRRFQEFKILYDS